MSQFGGRHAIWYFRLVVRGFLSLLLVIAIIFVSAGRLNYWQGWVFSGIVVLLVVIQVVVFTSKTDLIQERVRPGPGTKWWDRVFWVLYVPMYFSVPIIAGLDVGRFGWTTQLPASVYIASYIVFILSIFLFTWAMWVNRFFSSVVRIQTDRGQEVIQNGPYRFVRHPGYTGGVLMGISMSLVLGSLWALIPASAAMILLVIRTYLEDTILQKELMGYTGYAKKVRYRLLPAIW
jgi:protein-S-isoprenylcysteine O-methyltransferase Ste14